MTLEAYLGANFNPALWDANPISVAIYLGDAAAIGLDVSNEGLTLNSNAEPHFSLYFKNERDALAIFSNPQTAIAAFMRGEFRSSGYLMRTFSLLRACATG